MKRKILFFSLMLTFLFASCSNLIDELTVTKEKEANYTVTISDKIENGTVTASPTTAAAGTEITLTAEPASGYSFGSYSVTDTDGNSVKVENGKFKMPASNVNVSATFTAVTYTVTVASDIVNGTVTASPTTAAAGTEITLSVTPATGYQFATLTVTDAGGNAVTVTDSKFTMPASNVTVSATFTALPPDTASYTVKHLQQNIDDDNYTLKESETKTGTVGQPTAASAKSYDGFTAQTVTQVTVAASGTEVEIKYDRKTYTVTFDSNGGSDVSSQSLRYGAKATEPADPTKTATTTMEYTFAGWYSDSGLETSFSFDTAITGNIMLYAKWTETAVTPQKTAGSISYATTTVSKTTFDEAFTNELTKTGDGTVTYASSKTDVAEVNTQTGLVTIKGAGETTITATVADSDTYTYATKTASYTLTITYIGSKAPSEAKAVGDIVFSDGSATPYSADLTLTDAQKAAAIALIFYVGTDLNSGDDTTTSRTLGVGLKNATGLAWAKKGVNGYETIITAIQCTPSAKGKEAAATATFTGELDGSDNWKALCDAVSDEGTSGNYPAWEWVNAYATENSLEDSYENGWYLPTVAELSMLYREKDTVNSALEKAGGTKIADTGYWSSSQNASDYNIAWVVWFYGGYLSDGYKDGDNLSVCTVRAF